MTSQPEILRIFEETEALLHGHFQLTSGLHSAQYFQCAKVLQYPRYTELLCSLIAAHFRSVKPDVVIAPALGGIVVAQETGRQLDIRTIFTERTNGVMELRRGFELRHGERALVCEDVITTGGSVHEVIEIVRKTGGSVAGIAAIVDRSNGQSGIDGLFSCITLAVETFRPEDCPLCRNHVPLEKPGSRTGIHGVSS